jgi:X-Pro dipeptidyl-peptidase
MLGATLYNPATMFAPRPHLVLISIALSIGLVASSQSASASKQETQAKAIFVDGQAQVVLAFSNPNDWIREHLWVETEVDSDQDGKKDRVHVGVTRQKQTESEGLKVPVIYASSPYFAGTGDGDVNWNVRHEIGAEPPARTFHANIKFQPDRKVISGDLVRTWVPRGFAIVHSEATGTGLSNGSVTIGGAAERLAPKAVIDWLNGRAKGYKTVDGGDQIFAKWCTGKVGMTGTSYNGTIPIAAATTGVKGLECIIPVSPNTSYYHYYRSNGLVRSPGGYLGEDIDSLYDFVNSGNPAGRENGNKLYRDGLFAKNQDRKTGDYNRFWADRDLLRYARGIKCAVMMAHGFNDWNVMPEHAFRISNAIKGRVPLVQYFHQGGHGGDPPMEMMNKWFSRFLYGQQNGIENGPKSYIVRERKPDAPRTAIAPTPYADFPNPEAAPVALFPSKGGNTMGGLVTSKSAGQGQESFVDDVAFSSVALAQSADSPNRLVYATPELKAPLHLSGTARITIRVASSVPAANLSVYLVQLPWPSDAGGITNLITRGWADPQNAKVLTRGGDYQSMTPGTPLVPGQFVNLTFDLQPDDQIIPVGKRIGLMILSSDREFTIWPKAGTKLTIDLDYTKIVLPICGGTQTFMKSIE